MWVLWISFLLIGSITCVPPPGNFQGPYFSSGSHPAGSTGNFFSSVGQSGSPGGHHQSTQRTWTSSSDGGDNEPVFTPVSAKDQVMAHKARAHYKNHRMMIHRFVFIPTEPVEQQKPIYPHHDKMPQHGKGQVQTGF